MNHPLMSDATKTNVRFYCQLSEPNGAKALRAAQYESRSINAFQKIGIIARMYTNPYISGSKLMITVLQCWRVSILFMSVDSSRLLYGLNEQCAPILRQTLFQFPSSGAKWLSVGVRPWTTKTARETTTSSSPTTSWRSRSSVAGI